MPAPATPPAQRSALLLLVALLLGLGGSLLLAPPVGSPGLPLIPTASPGPVPSWLPLLLVGIFLASTFGVLVVRRLVYGGSGHFGPALIGAVVILVGIGMYALLRAVGYGPGPVRTGNTTSNGTGCASTGAGCPPPGGGGAAAGTGGGTALGYEGYLVFGAIIGIALLAIIVVPRVQGYLFARGESAAKPPDPAARTALEEALERLRAVGESDDPRDRIIRAYGELLARVQRGLPAWESSTPREIERECARIYRIRPATARELTGLFEEARYATGHAIGPEAVERAEGALRRALAEIRPPRVVRA